MSLDCHSITAAASLLYLWEGASARRRGSVRGEREPRCTGAISHRNCPGGCDWNLICLVHSVDILISISYNLLGKEAQLAAAWLNGLCTQTNLLHSQFPMLENLSVSLSEVSIAITVVLAKHWKWQPIQIVISLDSNCSSLHWPLKCYFSVDINCNWRRLVLCLCFQQISLPLHPN